MSGRFTWLDRKGRELETIDLGQVSNLYRPSLSPDGGFVTYMGWAGSGVEIDIWLYDLIRGRNIRVTTDPGRDIGPTWAPSGEYLAFTSNRTGTFDIYLRRADGSGEIKALTNTGNNFANDWSRDGRYLLYEETASDPFGDLWYLERNADGSIWEPRPYLQTRHGERFAALSPDGRFVAYVSNETGQEELNVRPFPEGPGRWTISTGGAAMHSWRSDGRELFYVSQGALMAVTVSTEPGFSMKTPTKLFALSSPYDVSADGQRFLVAPVEEDAIEPVIRVVQNWCGEFRDGQ